MSEIIRILVKSDEAEANVAKEKLTLKGYEASLIKASNIVLDGTDLGGHLDYLTDIDGDVYLVMGTK